ncbi:hypothetical protein BCR32DRAFT_265968 [Anaeromyces robustus]|uniref:Uncharacterized protein n=1 Tax=Anaeromyces robustus TaxID=1754192 RepID=A0A1Y1XGN2_9FUNG|nr:hypothetical protein BCR32DRAFT_265968 [Anaeromyces robustus]|eukprot:ORX84928.1 hypothetical protein BCR32DRAFT_265968 [Anaeromyces robustus]
MVAFASNKKKRLFPRVRPCICCRFLSPENSVKLTTVLMMIFYFATLILDIREYGFLSSFKEIIIFIIIMASLVFLLLGIKNGQLKHMKQFIYVFLIFSIYLIFKYVLLTYRIFFNDDYFNAMVEVLKENPKTEGLSQNQLEDTIKISNTFSFIYNTIYLFITIYYYLVTASYVKDIDEQNWDEYYVRDIEDAF